MTSPALFRRCSLEEREVLRTEFSRQFRKWDTASSEEELPRAECDIRDTGFHEADQSDIRGDRRTQAAFHPVALPYRLDLKAKQYISNWNGCIFFCFNDWLISLRYLFASRLPDKSSKRHGHTRAAWVGGKDRNTTGILKTPRLRIPGDSFLNEITRNIDGI